MSEDPDNEARTALKDTLKEVLGQSPNVVSGTEKMRAALALAVLEDRTLSAAKVSVLRQIINGN